MQNRDSKRSEGARETGKREMKGEREAGKGYVHLIHPSTFFFSFLLLLMIACTLLLLLLMPARCPPRCTALASAAPPATTTAATQHPASTTEYIQRDNTTVGEGEPNYQSTPSPPCTKTLPRRQRRLPPFLLVGYHPRHV